MPKYITFTVTPADGSPYEFWINADAVGNTANARYPVDFATGLVEGNGSPYAIFSSNAYGSASSLAGLPKTYAIYAVPVGTPSGNPANAAAPLFWYTVAIDKARKSNPDQIFVEAEGIPPDGISAISGTCPITTP